MAQINYQQKVNQLISAPTLQYPNRRFHLKKLLGDGADGGVYESEIQNCDQPKGGIALKIMRDMKEDEKHFVDELIKYQNQYENNLQDQNQSSYIIRVYERFQWNNQGILVMEAGGENLYDFCQTKKGSLSLIDKSVICKQILSSVCTLHRFKHIHRDIKSENFLQVGKIFKLCDFGLIRSLQNQRLKTMNVGTPLFRAPEIVNQDYTEKVDIWGVGCVFYEIITGKPLLQCQTKEEIDIILRDEESHVQIIISKINQLDISNEWREVIRNMLQFDQSERISAEDALLKLNKFSIIQWPGANTKVVFQAPTQRTYLQTQPPTHIQPQIQPQVVKQPEATHLILSNEDIGSIAKVPLNDNKSQKDDEDQNQNQAQIKNNIEHGEQIQDKMIQHATDMKQDSNINKLESQLDQHSEPSIDSVEQVQLQQQSQQCNVPNTQYHPQTHECQPNKEDQHYQSQPQTITNDQGQVTKDACPLKQQLGTEVSKFYGKLQMIMEIEDTEKGLNLLQKLNEWYDHEINHQY